MTIREVRKTVKDILKEYGPLGRPGKFEGEGIDTLYFYDAMVNGFGEDRGVEGELYSVHSVNAAERKVLDLPVGTVAFVVWENNQGFVYGKTLNKTKYRKFLHDVEALENLAD